MNRQGTYVQTLRNAVLLVGLLLFGPERLLGQGPSIPTPPTPPAEEPKTKEGPKPFWATEPPVTPMPRLGAFVLPPAGTGYYSLWDCLGDNERQSPPRFPYGPTSFLPFSFAEADFRYLDDPENKQRDWLFDRTKRIHLGDNWLFAVGGEERIRYMSDVSTRLGRADDVYELLRTQVYGDLWYRDVFRVFLEYLDANIYNQDLPPRIIDVNKSDLLDLFFDLKVGELADHPVYVRGGRQELLYGSQRLITPLDWANTRRRFDGVKAWWHSDKLDVDAFWTTPVVVEPSRFDSSDDGRNFEGLWATYRPRKGQTVDLYYLNLDDTHPVALGQYGKRDGFNVNTVGTRYAGDSRHLLWDAELMYQFGSWANQEIAAGAYTLGGGYHFADAPMNPQFWMYFDWAEGDPHPGVGGVHRRFNQLFASGHYYLGYLDLVGRENIDDFNLQYTMWPTKWWLTGIQFHVFHLDSPKDALYNAGATVLRSDPTGRAGTSVGNEIDLFTNFHLSAHQDIFLGWSKLYTGRFIKETGPPVSPELFYLQYTYKW